MSDDTLTQFKTNLSGGRYETVTGARRAIGKYQTITADEREKMHALANKHFNAEPGTPKGSAALKTPAAPKVAPAKKAPAPAEKIVPSPKKDAPKVAAAKETPASKKTVPQAKQVAQVSQLPNVLVSSDFTEVSRTADSSSERATTIKTTVDVLVRISEVGGINVQAELNAARQALGAVIASINATSAAVEAVASAPERGLSAAAMPPAANGLSLLTPRSS